MKDGARRAYRGFATFFLVVGSVFLALGAARAWVRPDLLEGDPLPVALLLLAIGAALRWTVRDGAGGEADGEAGGAAAHRPGDVPKAGEDAAEDGQTRD